MKNSKVNKKLIFILVVIAGSFWGLSFLATSLLVDAGLSPLQIQTGRWTVAGLTFLVMILCGKLRIDLRKKSAVYILLCSLAEPCIYMILESYGIAYTSSSIAAIFVATIPCMAMIFGAIFQHRSPGKLGIVSIFTAFSGVALSTILSPGFSLGGSGFGYLCMIGAVITGGAYICLSAASKAGYSPIQVTATMGISGLIFFNILNIVGGHGLDTYSVIFSEPALMGGIIFLGLFCSVICYHLMNKLIFLIDPALANNLTSSLTTSVGVIAGILVAGDPFGWYTFVGLALTLGGVCMSSKAI